MLKRKSNHLLGIILSIFGCSVEATDPPSTIMKDSGTDTYNDSSIPDADISDVGNDEKENDAGKVPLIDAEMIGSDVSNCPNICLNIGNQVDCTGQSDTCVDQWNPDWTQMCYATNDMRYCNYPDWINYCVAQENICQTNCTTSCVQCIEENSCSTISQVDCNDTCLQ